MLMKASTRDIMTFGAAFASAPPELGEVTRVFRHLTGHVNFTPSASRLRTNLAKSEQALEALVLDRNTDDGGVKRSEEMLSESE